MEGTLRSQLNSAPSGEELMKLKKSLFSAFFVVAFGLGGWASAHAQCEVSLLAIQPMRKATQRVVANFEAKSMCKVRVTYGNGVGTRRMVAQGQARDVSIIQYPFPGAMASETIIPSSATPIATLLTAIAVKKGAPKPDISTGAAVKKLLLQAKAVGWEDKDFASSGQGPWQAVTKLGIADQLLVKGAGISPTATAAVEELHDRLANGEIDLEMNMLSDLMAQEPDKYDIVGVLPREICIPDPIVAVLSTHARDSAGAKALLQYLASPEAKAVYKELGYGLPE
jgi:molybdate transport system substrate-binding protein